MIDERFSASEFSSCGLDTQKARRRSEVLAQEIESEIQQVAEKQFTQSVRRLNDMGHDLKPYVLGEGELSYRDDFKDRDGYHCKLRVAVDLVVSTGYADLSIPK